MPSDGVIDKIAPVAFEFFLRSKTEHVQVERASLFLWYPAKTEHDAKAQRVRAMERDG